MPEDTTNFLKKVDATIAKSQDIFEEKETFEAYLKDSLRASKNSKNIPGYLSVNPETLVITADSDIEIQIPNSHTEKVYAEEVASLKVSIQNLVSENVEISRAKYAVQKDLDDQKNRIAVLIEKNNKLELENKICLEENKKLLYELNEFQSRKLKPIKKATRFVI